MKSFHIIVFICVLFCDLAEGSEKGKQKHGKLIFTVFFLSKHHCETSYNVANYQGHELMHEM